MRRPLDAYHTPDALADALVALTVELYPPPPGSRAIEPSVGGGAFARPLSSRGVEVVGVDVDPHAPGLSADCWRGYVGDWTNPLVRGTAVRAAGLGRLWGVIGNPPYSGAQEHVEACMGSGAAVVGMLLRLAVLESARRVSWWERLQAGGLPLARVVVLSERPSFTGGATDACAYGWFVWARGHDGDPALDVLSWKSGRRPLRGVA